LGQLALLAADWRVVILAPLVIGFSIGGMNPVTSQILSPYASACNAAAITAIKQTGVPLGAVFAGLVGPLLAGAGGWLMAVACSTIAALVIAAALLPVGLTSRRREQAPRSPTHPLEPIKRLLALPGIKTVIVAGIAYVVAQFCLRSFFTVYLVRDVGLTLSFAGFAFAVTQAAGMAGQLFWGTLCGRAMTHHAVLAVIGALMALASGIMAYANGTWGAAAILGVSGLFGFTAAGFVPVVLGAVMTSSTADQAGALTSALNMFLLGTSLLGPVAFGGIARSFGYSGAFLAVAAACMVGALSCALGHMTKSSRSGRLAGQSISAR
jgi:predicted MFS family arabinose efflux permease